jgi:hypothetical protein
MYDFMSKCDTYLCIIEEYHTSYKISAICNCVTFIMRKLFFKGMCNC